ncbi:MAG: hypothetical protein ABI592_00295 [Acidobacteriota bacterium]
MIPPGGTRAPRRRRANAGLRLLPLFGALVVLVARAGFSRGAGPDGAPPGSTPPPAVAAAGRAAGPAFFASPEGSPSGDGSIGKPWDLQTALDQPSSVVPGSTIWLRGGTYLRRDDRLIRSHFANFLSRLAGRPGAPIMVRPYRNERVVLSGGNRNRGSVLAIAGPHAWYWDLEVTTSDPLRRAAGGTSNPEEVGTGAGIASNAPFVKLIHCVVHDNAVGISLGSGGGGTEAYGVLAYYNGWLAPDRPHGHGFYVQNEPGAPQTIRDSIVFRNFEYGAQSYGERAKLDDVVLEGSTLFNGGGFDASGFQGGYLVGGGRGAARPVVRNNDFYFPDETGQSLNVGYETYGVGADGRPPVAEDPAVTGNYFAGGHLYFHRGNVRPTYAKNTFFVGSINDQPLDESNAFRRAYPDNVFRPFSAGRPTGKVVHVRASPYERGRGAVTVFNWDRSASVSVDVRAIVSPGAPWRAVNAQDFFGRPVAAGESFDGAPVTLPMAGLAPASPVAFPSPAATGPEFNVFVILPGAAPPAPSPSPKSAAPGARGAVR